MRCSFLRYCSLFLLMTGLLASQAVLANEETATSEEAIILAAEPEAIGPDGELGAMFAVTGDSAAEFTKMQKIEKKAEVTGKIVQWTLEVYKVRKKGDAYRIQNSGDHGILSTFVYIKPRDDEEKARVEGLKMGDVITVKGKIEGFSLGTVFVLRPAFLIK